MMIERGETGLAPLPAGERVAAKRPGEGGLARPFIRPATVADLPACADIINGYIDNTDWLPRTKTHAEIAGFFTPELLEKRTVLVADAGGEIGAYVSAADGFLYAIYLAPAFRGWGLGKQLLDDLKRRYPQQLELTVYELNVAAQRFYEREGFAEVPGAREDTDEGVPVLRMRWQGAA
jgi:putative acetyltransferase